MSKARPPAAAHEDERILRLFIRHAPVAMAMFDREMRYLAVSDRWRQDHGLGDAELLGRTPWDDLPETSEHWRRVLHRCLAEGMTLEDEDPITRPDGGLDWMRWEARPWYARHGQVGGVFLFTEDITRRKEVEEALRYLATHDHLTGLLNRASFLDRLRRSHERVGHAFKYDFALLFLDLDGFKQVNDRLGHAAGDLLLQQIAGRLKEALRPKDALARFAGDEFVMLLEDVGRREEAEAAAARVLARLEVPFEIHRRPLTVRGSIGIALSEPCPAADDLLNRADAAMYRAKQAGGGKWAVHEPAGDLR